MRHKIEVGQVFLNGAGEKVTIIKTDILDGYLRNKFPVEGLVEKSGNTCDAISPHKERFTLEGKWDVCECPKPKNKQQECWYLKNLQELALTP